MAAEGAFVDVGIQLLLIASRPTTNQSLASLLHLEDLERRSTEPVLHDCWVCFQMWGIVGLTPGCLPLASLTLILNRERRHQDRVVQAQKKPMTCGFGGE